MSRVFTAQSMGKSFRGLEVLKGATLWCDGGSVSALLGRNGSGKTTLLECAFGLRRADYGVVHLGEHAYERPDPHRLARLGVFYLPDRDLLSPAHTVERHLKAAARTPPRRSLRSYRSPGTSPRGCGAHGHRTRHEAEILPDLRRRATTG